MDPVELREAVFFDPPADEHLDRLASVSAEIIGAPISLVTIIDRSMGRQVFAGASGLAQDLNDTRQTPLSQSFCSLVAGADAPLVISDAREDERVSHLGANESLTVAAYLGVPIHDLEDQAIGALCAIDHERREWAEREVERLGALAEAVSSQIRQRLALMRARADREALEEANRLFRDLASNVPGAIFRYVEQPDGRTEVDYMSDGCIDIWEVGPEEIVNDASRLWELVHPDDLAGMVTSVSRSAETLTRWRHRWRIQTPSGRLRWLDGYGSPRRGEHGETIWNSLILDATVEVEAQHRLDENTRLLQEAGKQEAIGQLAGGIAHDFNNLLAIIMSNAEQMLYGDGREDAQVLTEDILSASRRGGELTRRMLSFARKSNLHPTAFDMNEAVSSMTSLIHRTLPSNIAVRTSMQPGLWRTLADRSFLESGLLNLVVNARDAMPSGGQLTIETANVRITDEFISERRETIQAGRYVLLAVTDTGSGIGPGDLEKVFEPFFSTKLDDHGTGLGLAMVLGFAKQSGGTVRVYSEPDRGTAFKIFLPAIDEEAPARPEAEVPAPAVTSDCTVLLAEDLEPVRRRLCKLLQAEGATVVEAESGDAGLRLFKADPDRFDVVVTDVVMPGRLQGPELLQAIRKDRPGMPVVYVSGYPHEANVHGNGIAPQDITLMKPVDRASLLMAVGSALASSRKGR